LAEGRPTLCYAVDRAHAKHLQQKFEAAGVPCAYQDAHTDDLDRKAIKRDFHNGRVKVVCSVGTLTVGIDWDVRCISLCRPTKSDMLFVQIVGRGLRTAEGKDHCLILDHSDNHQRLGFVTDIDDSYSGLHVGKTPAHENRTDAIALPKECPQCAYLKPPKVATCPACGFTTKAVNGVTPEDGELRELKPKPKTKSETVDKVIFVGELRRYAKDNRKSEGWVSHTFRERFGVWPNAYKYVNASASVSRDTANWIRHRMIAYARMKAKEANHPQ
jgi:superfamily II DNA helicase RecQ